MKTSRDRILTTHVGSLPRDIRNIPPEDLAGVDAVVAKQVETGIDVVSDGEVGKIGYATYIKDRLSGFEGHYPRPPHLDLAPYPEFREAMARMIGKQTFKRAACVGPSVRCRPARPAGRIHERCVSGRHFGFSIESLLPDARGVCRRDRRGHAG